MTVLTYDTTTPSHLWNDAPALTGTAVTLTVLLAVFSMAGTLDERLFNGIAVWTKPAKFAFSLAVYTATLALFARFVPEDTRGTRKWRFMIGAVVFSIAAEMVWIGGAAAYGVGSHFNVSSGAMATVYAFMGVFATVLTSATAFFAVAIHRNAATGLPPVVKSALVWGLGLTLPLTLLTAGLLSAMGSHWIGGTPSDAAGLPIFGWSRDGGDLRVAHFFATHMMHIVPLAGLAAYAVGARGVTWARAAAAGFTLLVLGTFAQALMGRPFLGWL